MAFSNEAFLWYNVPGWDTLGLAIPNFGIQERSQNDTIRYLNDVMGRNLQAIMFHPDSKLRSPPSINTLVRVHKLITRGRSILASRQVASGQFNMEPAHAVPAAEEFMVYPTPYFQVRNQWMKQWCGMILMAMSEAMQHQENSKPIEISMAFSGLIGQYLQRVYKLMATELFQVDAAAASAPDFVLSDTVIASYDPSKWFTSTEMIDTVYPDSDVPTQDDLRVITDGIAISQLPKLTRWPYVQTITTPSTATPVDTSAAAAAVTNSTPSFAPAPSA